MEAINMAEENTKRKAFEAKKKEIEEKTQKDDIQEYINQTQRIQAEFENYKKRTDKEKEIHADYSKAILIKELLPVLDSFDSAVKLMEKNDKLDEGIKMLHSEINNIMEKQGLKSIEAVGCKLDPFKHEVIQQKDSEEGNDRILEEVQKGYMFKDKVLRTSKVIISKNIGGK